MLYRLSLLIFAVVLAGCAGSSSPAPQPTATVGNVAHIELVPTTAPPPTRAAQHGVASGHSGAARVPTPRAVSKLPTPRRVTFVTPTPIPASAYSAAIQGTVIDAKGHYRIAGAVVTVGAHHVTYTNANGQYRVTFPTGADVPVEVTKRGFASRLAMGSISPHKTVTLNFTLTPLNRRHPIAPAPPTFFGHR